MTIYIIDKHPLMRQSISNAIKQIEASKRIVEANDYLQLEMLISINGTPEAFIIDPTVDYASTTSLIKQLKKLYPLAMLMLFTEISDPKTKSACADAGADFYLEKTASIDTFSYYSHNLLHIENEVKIEQQELLTTEKHAKLSKRQKQLIHYINEGLNNNDIAEILQISPHTIKVHLWRLYKKFNIKSRTQLLKVAREQNHIKPL